VLPEFEVLIITHRMKRQKSAEATLLFIAFECHFATDGPDSYRESDALFDKSAAFLAFFKEHSSETVCRKRYLPFFLQGA